MQIPGENEETIGGVSPERKKKIRERERERSLTAAKEPQRDNITTSGIDEPRTNVGTPPSQRSSTSSVIPSRQMTIIKPTTHEYQSLDVNKSFLHRSFDNNDHFVSNDKLLRQCDDDDDDDDVDRTNIAVKSNEVDVEPAAATATLIYATIDSLALKGTTLPLRLLPIDVNSDPITNNAADKRKTFKIKPSGLSVTSTQLKSRDVRSNLRNHSPPPLPMATRKMEDVAKGMIVEAADNDVVKKVKNVVTKKNNNQHDCENYESAPAKSAPTIDGSREINVSSSFNDSKIERVIEGEKNLSEDRSLELLQSRSLDRTVKINSTNEESIESKNIMIVRENHAKEDDSCTSKERVTLAKKKTMKKLTKLSRKRIFADKRKSASNLTIANSKNQNDRNSGAKSRKNERNTSFVEENSGDGQNSDRFNARVKERKYLTRKELRYASISSPTNFVHVSSATSSRLLSPNTGSKEKWTIVDNDGTFRDLPSESGIHREIGENSNIGEAMLSTVSVLEGDTRQRNDNLSRGELDEKVRQLEKSQGVPEVVKISENEDNRHEFVKRSRDENTCETTMASSTSIIYESMSEFSTNLRTSSSSPAPPLSPFIAGKMTINTSFLWGTSMTGQRITARDSTVVNDQSPTGIIMPGQDDTADENVIIADHSIGAANNYDDETYDDVGHLRMDEYASGPHQQEQQQHDSDHYDDVGLPLAVRSSWSSSSSSDTVFEEISVYDDVIPTTPKSIDDTTPENGSPRENKKYSTLIINSSKNHYSLNSRNGMDENYLENDKDPNYDEHHDYLSIGNEYSSLQDAEVARCHQEKDRDEDELLLLYDDIQLPCQERVNSLYAGSSSAGSLLGSLIYNGKESEWEDLEEIATVAAPVSPLPMSINNNNNQTWASRKTDESPSSSSNKKKMAQRRSRRVKRQKSKLSSRKNLLAGRSISSSSTTVGTAKAAASSTFSDSDDSNYETLFSSFPSDEFSDDDDDAENDNNQRDDSTSKRNGDSGVESASGNDSNMHQQEAPSRPVPPPPRESSLTETLGKQMKMLRRTWSITKGSLGRMRRRTSTSNVDNYSSNIGNDIDNKDTNQRNNCPSNDGRNKYLSFKKHFRKSVTGLSKFYLDANDSSNVLNDDADGDVDDDDDDDKKLSHNNNRSKEVIYSNISDNCNNPYTDTNYSNCPTPESRNNSHVDHYSMLDEEPLYQFYAAAAAARVAFESDSEGYEEVEDPTPSSSAVNFARPGQRTLWCQTPQVINSTLLQSLTSDEKKVQEAKFEILTSEASYLNSLRVLVDQFLNNHDLVHEILTPSEKDKLFGGVPSVLGASERLLAEFEAVWREDLMLEGLPEILLNYAQKSSGVYVAYCSNQVSIDTTLKELRSRKGSKFADTLARIECHTACQSLSLHSFLMLPMQRVTRLPLLADAVLSRLSTDKKKERTRWEVVLSQFSRVVVECNEGARAAGRLAEMEQLERKLEYSPKVPPIVLRDRHLIRRGPVVQLLAKSEVDYKLTFGKKYHKTSLYLLLLSDYLLIAKPKSATTNEETYTVLDTCKRRLVALEKVTEQDSPFAGRNAMILTLLENHSGRHVEYVLTCDNTTERERWIDAISPPKPSLVGETLYETWDCPQVMALYSYVAAQPDELTLQPGDVMNVLRKMTDGWYLGEKLLGGQQGWFPGNYAKEVASEHVRARNLRQRHRLLALSASVLQERAKQLSR